MLFDLIPSHFFSLTEVIISTVVTAVTKVVMVIEVTVTTKVAWGFLAQSPAPRNPCRFFV